MMQRYTFYAAVTKSDTVNFPDGPCDGLYIGDGGSTGTAIVVMQNGNTVTFTGLVAGSILPIRAYRINDTDTDVASVIALYD